MRVNKHKRGPGRPPGSTQPPTKSVSFRLTAVERRLVEQTADRFERPTAQFLRLLALRASQIAPEKLRKFMQIPA